MSHTPVLIAGSGPTGLVTAIQLATRGVECRIVDRLEGPVQTSRAFTIHARTLELLDQLGLAETFIDEAIITKSMDYHFPQLAETPKLDFTELASVYPFCLTIGQTKTEAILRKKVADLGVQIEWNKQLTGFEADGERVRIQLRDVISEATDSITANWLAGCDGFRSTVRKNLDLPLDGEDYEGMMKMMDVAVENFPDSHDAIHYYVSKENMLLINKLPGKHYRVLISDKEGPIAAADAKDQFQAVLDQHFGGAVTIGEPDWTTNFYIGRRQVNSYRHGSVFLAGDAAHINSPAGGQGMNVSMQDAFNLGWKLAMVAKGEAQPELLDTYETERAPIAAQMLEGTDHIHSIIMAHGKGMTERLERLSKPGWNKEAVNQIAGISYTYREEGEDALLAMGDRAPDIWLDNGSRLHSLVSNKGFTLLMVPAEGHDVADLRARADDIEAEYDGFVRTQVVGDQRLTEYYGPSHTYLVRPDCHIVHIGHMDDAKGWRTALKSLLGVSSDD